MNVAAPTPLINATTFPASRFADFSTLTNLIVPFLTVIAAFIFGFMLFKGAFIILTGSGESKSVTKARDHIFWGVVGLVVIISANLIVQIVEYIITGIK